MTMDEKATLLEQATLLAEFGVTVEMCRNKLRKLVKKKVPYDSLEMRTALAEFLIAQNEWNRLEQEHLTYRDAVSGQGEIA